MMTFSVVHLRVYDKSTFFRFKHLRTFYPLLPTFSVWNQLAFYYYYYYYNLCYWWINVYIIKVSLSKEKRPEHSTMSKMQNENRCLLCGYSSGYKYVGYASMDMDISMDIHVKSVDYGYGCEISYPRQPWHYWTVTAIIRLTHASQQKSCVDKF